MLASIMADVQKNFNRLQQELKDRSLSTTIVESGILTIIVLVTLLGNVLVCRAVYQSPRLRTITNYSVVVLALTDISMAVFVLPLVLVVSILNKTPFGHLFCQIEAYTATSLVYNSVLTITFMSVNRYFKIVRSDQLYRKIFTRRKTMLMLLVIIIVAWLGPMNAPLQGQKFQFHPGKMICLYSYKQQSQANFALLTFFFFTLPYCITIFCYCSIYIKVRSHNKRIANAAPSTTNNTTTTTINRKDINITKTLFAIFLVFTLCMMQLAVVDTTEFYNGEYKLPRQVYVLYTLMCGLASAVNPFIYGLFSPAFRSEYKRSLCLTTVSSNDEASTSSN
ncbi:melatonin receptor type 1A-like [Actinia tenebrosa]|uniref:Melatonin receptor type 1A-like n=1 Tax=Actinia tenebrosa TaxID=6105 RepID=A0A6P8HBI1_ACTTE|nr:melatonin receptor type 1A-like [Actinia tenebrosa]